MKTEDKTEYIRALLKMRDNYSELNNHLSSLLQGSDSPSGSYIKEGKYINLEQKERQPSVCQYQRSFCHHNVPMTCK